MTTSEVIPTGIAGLDNVLHGGILRQGFYLLQGEPGSGKTTIALQYVRRQLELGERCLYVSLTESRADLERACASHGWSFDAIPLLDLTNAATQSHASGNPSVFHPADTELSDLTQAVADEVTRLSPQHVVFDGMSELRLLSADPLRYRRTLLWLKDFLVQRGVTTLLLDDRSAKFDQTNAESMVGANIVLDRYLPAYGRAQRRLHVTKVRGSDFREGYHDYEIVRGGLAVHPRLVAGEHQSSHQLEVVETGISNFDTMLGGGLHAGSTNLLMGPAGAGKSTAAMQVVVSALRRQKKAAVYIFDEVMQTFLERSEKLCLAQDGGIRSYIDQGYLRVKQVDPAELTPGAFAHEVRRGVDEGVEVVVIDSLNGYLGAMLDERFLTTHLHELFAYLNQKGVLTILVVAQHGMIAGGKASDMDVSYMADTVVMFRYYEVRGEVKQALSVFKKRTGGHERSIRELTIDAQGMRVGEPLRQFRGILTGVPHHDREGDTPTVLPVPAPR